MLSSIYSMPFSACRLYLAPCTCKWTSHAKFWAPQPTCSAECTSRELCRSLDMACGAHRHPLQGRPHLICNGNLRPCPRMLLRPSHGSWHASLPHNPASASQAALQHRMSAGPALPESGMRVNFVLPRSRFACCRHAADMTILSIQRSFLCQ